MKTRDKKGTSGKKPSKGVQDHLTPLSQFVDFLPDPTFAIDLEGRVTVWNRAMEEFTHVKAEHMVGKGSYEYALPLYGERRPILIDLVLHPDPERDEFYISITRQGDSLIAENVGLPSRRFLWGKASPIYDTTGAITGAIESIRDITDRKHIEETLLKSEARYRDIFENVSDYLYLHDLEGLFLETNFANKKETGYTAADLKGLSIQDLLPERHKHRFLNYMKNVVDNGYDEGFLTILIKTGEERVLEYRNSLITDKEGWPVAVRGSARDITARLKTQRELRKERDFISSIIQTSPAFYVAVDKNHRIILMNEAMLTTLNYTLHAVTGRDFVDTIVHRDDQASMREAIATMITSHASVVRELRMTSRDGRDLLVQLQAKPVFRADGSLDFIFGIGIDITGQKLAEEQKRISEKKFQVAFQSSVDPMTIIDAKTSRIVDVNRAFEAWTGYTRDDAIGRTTAELHIWQSQADRERLIAELSAGRNVENAEVRLRKLTGEVRDVLLSATLVDVEGRPYIFSLSHDITELRRAEERISKSEQRYRLLAQNATDVIWVLDLDLKFSYVSPSVQRLRGFTVQEVLQQTLKQVFTPASYRTAVGILRHERQKEEESIRRGPEWSMTAELEMTCKDGSTVWTEATLSILYNDAGETTGILAITRDITLRRQAQTALNERQRQLETLMGNLPGMAYRCRNDPDWTMEFVSQGCMDLTGYSPDDLTMSRRVSFASLIHPGDRERIWTEVQAAIDRREPFRLTYRITARDGRERWVWEQGTGVYSDEGALHFLEGFITDITERRQAEQALRTSEERYRILAENARDVIWVLDMDLRYLFVSPSVVRTTGFTVEETMRQGVEEAVSHESYLHALQVLGEELEREEQGLIHDPFWSRTLELELVKKGGATVWCEITASFLRDEQGKVSGILGITRDISDRRRAEKGLRESERKYRELMEQAADGIFVIDAEGEFLMVNSRTCEMLGYAEEELLRISILETYPDDIREQGRERLSRLAAGDRLRFERPMKRKDGSVFLVEASATKIDDGRMQAIIHDITERKHAEEERTIYEARLARSQKLEAIGTLAGGIAHDFNNILSAIIGYSELVQEDLPSDTSAYANIEQVLKAGDRARDLVRQILAFSRQVETELAPVQISIIIKESLKLLRSSIPSIITIRENIDPRALPVFADPIHIHQVIMNLCTNAYHAMLPQGGDLSVSLDPVTLDADFASQHPPLSEGQYMKLTVEDTGCGMDEETMKRIFDPFFTTKDKGLGTGLGLATVHGIVTSLNGGVYVRSAVGKGSTFDVYLPIYTGNHEDLEEPDADLFKGHGESILLVDDEAAILQFAQTMLEQLGYAVTGLASSREALDMFRSNPRRFDLIITDQTMPGMTGSVLAVEALRTRPDTPIILMTGYSEIITPEEALALGIEEYLEKPFTKSALAHAIQRCLTERAQK